MAKINLKKKLQFWGTGRRKKAIARVRLIPAGSGTIVINDRTFEDYFPQGTLQYIVKQPLVLLDVENKYDVFVNVIGGGYTGQSVLVSRARFSKRNPIPVPPSKRKASLPAIPAPRKERSTASKRRAALRSSPRDNLREFSTFQQDDKAPTVLVTVGAFESKSVLFENIGKR